MNLTGTVGRLVHAILYGLIVFVVLFIIGLIAAHFDESIGALIEKFAGLIAVLAAVYFYITGAKPVA